MKSVTVPRGTKSEVAANPEKYGANGVLKYRYWTQEQIKDYTEYRRALDEKKAEETNKKWDRLKEVCADIEEALDLIDELQNGSKATRSSCLSQLFGTNTVTIGACVPLPTEPQKMMEAISLMAKVNAKGKVALVIKDNNIVVDSIAD